MILFFNFKLLDIKLIKVYLFCSKWVFLLKVWGKNKILFWNISLKLIFIRVIVLLLGEEFIDKLKILLKKKKVLDLLFLLVLRKITRYLWFFFFKRYLKSF